uniref:Ricin B-type lectin domain-containing protein n=1 Tax=Panagrellus redivivus TaxID=6233 RepID=A0A7E4VFN8_PANRE
MTYENDDFCDRVNAFLQGELMGPEIIRVYGLSKSRQQFVFVTSAVVWYAVRLIIEMPNGKLRLIERKEFLLPANADDYIFNKKRELEGVYCWNGNPISTTLNVNECNWS